MRLLLGEGTNNPDHFVGYESQTGLGSVAPCLHRTQPIHALFMSLYETSWKEWHSLFGNRLFYWTHCGMFVLQEVQKAAWLLLMSKYNDLWLTLNKLPIYLSVFLFLLDCNTISTHKEVGSHCIRACHSLISVYFGLTCKLVSELLYNII